MTFKQRMALYDNEIDKLLLDSFEPYASIVKENKEAEEECREVLNRPRKETYINTMLDCRTISTIQ